VTVASPPLIRRVPRLRPRSGRPPGSPARTGAWPKLREAGMGSGGAGGSWLRAASPGSERLPAPPSRAGTARSDVSAAPPAPLPLRSPHQCGMEGAEADGEGPQPCAPAFPPPTQLASWLFPGRRAAPFSPPRPPRPAPPGSPIGPGRWWRAAGWKPRWQLQAQGSQRMDGEPRRRGASTRWAERGRFMFSHF
jgi:hypothetical protein